MMSEREPALLGGQADGSSSGGEASPASPTERADSGPTERTATPAIAAEPTPRPSSRREAPAVYVVGFWKRFVAALIDFALIGPAALLITWIASKVAGVHLPPSNLRIVDLDMWVDLVLAADPALVMGTVLLLAVAMIYLLVFQIVLGRTLGMRVLNMRIIDVYGDRPSPARCVARCAGYLAGVATLFLGFLWMGFDSEKRGLQDWIAGTYVIRG